MSVHDRTVEGFGAEWAKFDQAPLDEDDLRKLFEAYFAIFPWDSLPSDAVVADIGCGSGRWARFVAPRVRRLLCLDPSPQALGVARSALSGHDNCTFVEGAAGALPMLDGSLDAAYSLGVLHHAPDTEAALRDCVAKVKPGGVFLVYLYYAFDNRPGWFRVVWQASDLVRRVVSRAPFRVRYWLSQALAAGVYWPLARTARWLERRGRDVSTLPLSAYRDRPFYMMRNDALDRFGTQMETRFTAAEIETMMRGAGLVDVTVGSEAPYWCAVGTRP
jgi:SAM-dependent methyltransferase